VNQVFTISFYKILSTKIEVEMNLTKLHHFSYFQTLTRNIDELVKSDNLDGTVKSARCKANESLGMRRTYKYVGMTKDEVQRSRWIFYEAVNIEFPK
jgi:hypothetical protein